MAQHGFEFYDPDTGGTTFVSGGDTAFASNTGESSGGGDTTAALIGLAQFLRSQNKRGSPRLQNINIGGSRSQGKFGTPKGRSERIFPPPALLDLLKRT